MVLSKKTIEDIKKNPKLWANKKSINVLVKTLEILNDQYYNYENPYIDDITYDKLYEILKKRDPNNSFLKQVGATTNHKKIKLEYYMPSLSKIIFDEEKDIRKLKRWIQNYKGPYFISDKLDGVSALLIKKNNEYYLYTRGNGEYGSDISHLLNDGYLLQDNILKELPNNIAIRGEILCSKENFASIPLTYEVANSRSCVTSVVNSIEYKPLLAEKLDFIAYSILNFNISFSKQIELLDKYSFPRVYSELFDEIDENILNNYYKDRYIKTIYNIDGIVISDDSEAYFNKSIEDPKYSFAFKNYELLDHATTKVIDIDWNYTKDSYIFPTIKIETISLEGTNVSNVTGNNGRYIIENSIGKNSIVSIIKGGSIIPKIIKVIKPSIPGTEKLPLDDIIWSDTGSDLIYIGKDPSILTIIKINKIIFFFETLKIKSLGEGLITKLVNYKYDHEIKIIDLFINKKKNLYKIDGFGQKIVAKISMNIKLCFEKIKLEDLMAASNIFSRGIGSKKIKLILDNIPNVMTKSWENEKLKDIIINIPDIGIITAEKFSENLNSFKKYYEELNNIINIQIEKKIIVNDGINFNNKIFTLTGTRDSSIIDFIQKHNGIVKEGFSLNVDTVIYKDGKKSNTYNKAIEKNIKTISDINFKSYYKIL